MNQVNKFESRYEQTGKMEDLEEAISLAREAVVVTPNDHPDRADQFNNLGIMLIRRYKRTGKMEDLEEAISLAREAVVVTSNDHPNRAGRLKNLENMEACLSERIDPQNQMHSNKFDSFENSLNNQKDPEGTGLNRPDEGRTFVDSTYETASRGQPSEIKVTLPWETVPLVEEIDDSRTEYSDLSVADSQINTYLARLANDLYAVTITMQPDSQRIKTLCRNLPEMLQQFAQRVSNEVMSKEGREVMYYVHRHRRRVAELLEKHMTNEDDVQGDSASTFSTAIPFQEKVQNWFNQDDPEINMPDDLQLDHDFSLELELDVERYSTLVSQTSAYRWLVASIGRELTLTSEDNGLLTILRSKIWACLPPLPKISTRRQPEHLKLLFKVKWDPMMFIDEQEYYDLPVAALEKAITLTGLPKVAQALPCFQYLKQAWPSSSSYIISLLEQLMCADVDQKIKADSSDGGFLTAWRSPPFLYVEASGSRSGIAEVGEQLAWLGAALRSSPYIGPANCRPYIDDSDQTIEGQSELRLGRGQNELKPLNIDFAFDQDGLDDKNSEGQCWQSLFRNPVLVRGFPVLRRGTHQHGLEMPLNMMAGLIGAVRAHVFNGVVVIKGFSSMAIPSGQADGLLKWHVFFDPDGGHISYLRHELPPLEGVGLSNLQTLRHVVGWCARTQSCAGRPEANYRIGKSRLPTLGTGCALEKVSISGGMFINMGFNFGIGIKDVPLHVSRKPYVSKLRQVASTYFVFWDTEEKRGWLVNGISALLHLLRASLEHYRTDLFKFALLSQPTDISEPPVGSPGEYAIRVLLDEQNRALPLYLDKDEEYTEHEHSVGKVRASLTKRKKTYQKLQDRVEELYEILEKIIAHQVDVTGKGGVNMKSHARKRLEGWDFKDLASELDPSYPRFTTLHACGKGWVDFVRSIHAVTLFGKGFGELIRSSNNTDCPRWTKVPKDRYYLAALVSDLRQIMEKEGSEEASPMQLCTGISWFSSGAAFDACRCTKAPGSGHSDFVQTLWPTSLRRMLPNRERFPLHDDGAVIFGHNVTLKWKWPDKGDPIRGDPAVEPAVTETEEEFHDSGMGTIEPEDSEQTAFMLPESGNYYMVSSQQLQAPGPSFAEPGPSSAEPAVHRAAGISATDQTGTAKSAGKPKKVSQLERARKYLPWASSRTKQR